MKEKWLSRVPRRDKRTAGIRTQSQILIVLPRKPHGCVSADSVREDLLAQGFRERRRAAAVLWLKPAPRKPASVQRGVVGEQRVWEAAPGQGGSPCPSRVLGSFLVSPDSCTQAVPRRPSPPRQEETEPGAAP